VYICSGCGGFFLKKTDFLSFKVSNPMLDIALFMGGLLPLFYCMYVCMCFSMYLWVYMYSISMVSGKSQCWFHTGGWMWWVALGPSLLLPTLTNCPAIVIPSGFGVLDDVSFVTVMSCWGVHMICIWIACMNCCCVLFNWNLTKHWL
jgi:hypothetical protein